MFILSMDDSAFQNATALHQAGRLTEALAIYRKILEADPEDVDVIHFMGVLYKQIGQKDEALRFLERAVELDPEYAEAHFNLAAVLAERGLVDRAQGSYEKAIKLKPDYIEARFNLANVLLKTNQVDQAIDVLQSALKLNPGYAKALNLLGNALMAKNSFHEAVEAYRRAIDLTPNSAELYNNIARPLKEIGGLDDALAAYHKAIDLKPDFAEAHSNLGIIYAHKGNYGAAMASCRRAIELKPSYPQAHHNLGNALLDAGQVDEAIDAYKQAIQLKPDFAEAYHSLANAQLKAGQPDLAIDLFNRAIQLKPVMAQAYAGLANAFKEKGQISDTILTYRRAVALDPKDARLHSNLVYDLHYDPACTPSCLQAEERNWAQRYADPLKAKWPLHKNDRNPERRLKIGYVSPDFRQHPVGQFMLPLLAHHDHSRFEIFCYASVRSADDLTAKIRSHADVWRDISPLSDEQAAAMAHSDEIDIMVDLTMHTAKHRLLMFARKPSPIQIAYLAYPGSTGIDAIDYRLTDPYLDPPGSETDCYSEGSFRLPTTYWCYQPQFEGLDSSPLPAKKAGFVTFGSLNNFCKVNPAVVETWKDVLLRVPESRLALHSAEGAHRQRVLRTFEEAGVDPARIRFVKRQSAFDYMNYYRNIDIALDPFPYVGGTTTCDALWMGVPVVTLHGQTALARGGVSILTNAGITDLIAKTREEYVLIAANLASDLGRLEQLRSTIRDQMMRSPLMDAKRFAFDVENAYREMWRAWCQNKRPAS
jgi:protein O-GlcNAc transferase